MSPVHRRGLPARMRFAIAGAIVALVATGLPWMASTSPAIPDALGYQDSVIWVAVRVIAAVGSLLLATKLLKTADPRETQRAVFAGAGVVFAMRPIYLIVTNPGRQDFESLGVKLDRLFTPTYGLYLSFFAAALMLIATVLTHRSDEERVEAEREAARAALLEDPELAAFAGPAPAPLAAPAKPVASPPAAIAAVPTPATAHSPSSLEASMTTIPTPEPSRPEPGFAPDPATYIPPVPLPAASSAPEPRERATHAAVPFAPGAAGPYGPDGPSRLGEKANLVRLDDPYAPRQAAPAPHVSLRPVVATPEIAQPAPADAPAPAPERRSSVAPPGFG